MVVLTRDWKRNLSLQILGDQQAALVGQMCFKGGQAKNTCVAHRSRRVASCNVT